MDNGSRRKTPMSRTARLFRLMEALRGHRRPVTASFLASELAVSSRTVYRDVQTLVGLGAPIEGEAGVGYLLRAGFFLPPLMFGEDELEALVLGARWVQGQGDAGLASAAARALAKIATACPRDMRDKIAETGLWAAPVRRETRESTSLIREAIRREQKLEITYVDEVGKTTERVIWPIGLAFFEGRRIVAAWCELRSGFRHFRTDRIASLTPTRVPYPTRRAMLVKSWRSENSIPDTVVP
jgi:predicted DNA-binding transcriptional regulator YafY